MPTHQKEALIRARCCLEGLSVGDAFGQQFFEDWPLLQRWKEERQLELDPHGPDVPIERLIATRQLPPAPWRWTDDTQMALSVFRVLAEHSEIVQDELAQSFSEHFEAARDYGAAMNSLLPRLASERWQESASSLFDGVGSFGNGAAMRVAPIGAYFADDLQAVVENARRSAEVTHAHEEGIAGAIAVAVATAQAWRLGQAARVVECEEFLDLVLPHIPESEVRWRTVEARDMSDDMVQDVADALGSGFEVSAQDTVPFCLWCAGQHLDHWEETLWLTVAGLGDRDTTCAIVGGIVAMYGGVESIPPYWIEAREPLPQWAVDCDM
ncbi:MAG TPA: ADP-ribosylglycohydrolase family protein [Abditibacteriaceae bacterium]|jgi:ADP-ribosylglycohydrolase